MSEKLTAETAAQHPEPDERIFRRPLLWVGMLCIAVLVVLLFMFPVRGDWPYQPVTGSFSQLTQDGRVNLNAADLAALCSLPGIGRTKAQAILDWRTANGPFVYVEQLLEVEGVGEKTLDALREHICIG